MLTRSLLLTAAAAALVSSQTEPAVERSNELLAEFGRNPTTTGLVGQYLLDNDYLAAFENSDAVAIGPESEVDCSLYPDGSFEYYYEGCYDEYHMHWVNGVCRNGVKEEMNELHRCAMFDSHPLDITGRRYCHHCEATDGKPWKTLCGSDEPDKEKACLVALSDGDDLPDGGCAELETTTYYHQCNSAHTSSYNRQELYCDGTKKPYIEDDPWRPYTVRCGVEWYYPFASNEPIVFSSEHKYCLDCGEAIGVCSDDPDKGCVAHGMPPRGRKFNTTVAPETASDTVDGDALGTLDSVAATPVPPEENMVDEGEGDDDVGLVDFWYPDYNSAWPDAGCLNTLPLPFNRGDRPEYDTQIECCKAAYGGQTSGKCLSQLASPPTTSPTMAGGVGLLWYPDYNSAWPDAGCKNEVPHPFSPGGRPVYDTQLECCEAAYGGQTSGKCLSELASPPTASPTMAGGVGTEWYPDYSSAWSDAGCLNAVPKPFNDGDRPVYDTQLECCKAAYGGQSSGKCLSGLASPPSTSPTMAGGVGTEWYPDYGSAWSDAGCLNAVPKPFNDGDRPVYATQLECCKAAYGGQTSGKCLSGLASAPTTSPTSSRGANVYYPDYSTAWSDATCINDYPVPSGRPTYSTQSACCSGAYGGQTSQACVCAVDPCYSCKCGNTAFLTSNNCGTLIANCSR